MSEFDYVAASIKISGEAALPSDHEEYSHGDVVHLVVRAKVTSVEFPEKKDIITRVHRAEATDAYVVDAEEAEKMLARAEPGGQRSIYNGDDDE